jgi:hypothetical protein
MGEWLPIIFSLSKIVGYISSLLTIYHFLNGATFSMDILGVLLSCLYFCLGKINKNLENRKIETAKVSIKSSEPKNNEVNFDNKREEHRKVYFFGTFIYCLIYFILYLLFLLNHGNRIQYFIISNMIGLCYGAFATFFRNAFPMNETKYQNKFIVGLNLAFLIIVSLNILSFRASLFDALFAYFIMMWIPTKTMEYNLNVPLQNREENK